MTDIPYTEPFSKLFKSENKMSISPGSNDELVMDITPDQERELAFTSMIIIDDVFFLNILKSSEFARAYAACKKNCIVGQGNSKFYVLKKII